MTDAVDVRVLHRREEPAGELVPGAVETGVDRGHDPVPFAESLVREVERAIGPDIDLHPGEHRDATHGLVQRGDRLGLAVETAVLEPLRMVADGHIAAPERLSREDHLLERGAPV